MYWCVVWRQNLTNKIGKDWLFLEFLRHVLWASFRRVTYFISILLWTLCLSLTYCPIAGQKREYIKDFNSSKKTHFKQCIWLLIKGKNKNKSSQLLSVNATIISNTIKKRIIRNDSVSLGSIAKSQDIFR